MPSRFGCFEWCCGGFGSGVDPHLGTLKRDDGVAIRMKDGRFREARYIPHSQLLNKPSEEDKDKYAAEYSTAIDWGVSMAHLEFVDKTNIWVLDGEFPDCSESSWKFRFDVPEDDVATLIGSDAMAIRGSETQDIQLITKALGKRNQVVYLNLSQVKGKEGEASGNDWCCTLAMAIASNRRLLHLNLGKTGIGLKGCGALSEMLTKNSVLKSLDISSNEIGDEGCSVLAQALAKNGSLEVLCMNGCAIQDQGATELAQALGQSTALKLLRLEKNKISDAGGFELANAIPKCSLMSLELGGNTLSGPKWVVGQKVRVSSYGTINSWYHGTLASADGEELMASVVYSDGSGGQPDTWRRIEPEEGDLNVIQTIDKFLQEKDTEPIKYKN